MIILFSPIASSRTVFQVNYIDIIPQGEFDNSDEWEIETQFGFTEFDAENTDLTVGDGKISINHEREQNLKSMVFWSTESNSGHESSIGSPDSEVSISTGADIDLSGFDFNSVSNFPLVSNSLVVSFRISDGLNDDRVEISVASEDSAYLIKSYSNTFSEGEVNNLEDPYFSINFDEYREWSWDLLSNISVKLNYESVGGSDEAQLEVDAVGIKVTYQMVDSGFDFVKAQTLMSLSDDYEYGNLSLDLSGFISGDFGNLDQELSWLKLQMGTSIIHEIKINTELTNFEININLEKDLFLSQQELIFAIGVQIYWDSDGSYSNGNIIINELNINGITITEWDENPQCDEIDDYTGSNSFLEDSGEYVIISLFDYCSDDMTEVSDLDFSVDVINESIIRAEIEEGFLKIYQIPQSSGFTEIVLEVVDDSGNMWIDNFFIEVVEVNDPPVISEFPDEVWVEIDEVLILEGEIYDFESNIDELEISVNNVVGTINNNELTIFSNELGIFDLLLSVSDGELVSTHELRVNVFSEPDLAPISLYLTDNDGDELILDGLLISDADSNVRIFTEIENLGKSEATFISIRFYSNDKLIYNTTLSLISSNSSKIVEFDWVPSSLIDNYSIKVIVDSNNVIDESNELNNELYLNFSINSDEKDNIGVKSNSLFDDIQYMSLIIIFGFILLSLLIVFGPKKIKKIS